MEYFVYIIFSKTKNRFYIGSTSALQERLVRHNQNNKGFTGKISDWVIMYSENFLSRNEALIRELQIKKWKSRKMIEKLIADSQGI